ncbi:hypothetical protein ABZZ80_41690 [Streptomyces sp. NPDC006356]
MTTLTALATLTACGSTEHGTGADVGKGARTGPAATTDRTRIPGIGDRWQRHIPAGSRQVVAVYGDGRDSSTATVVLYARQGSTWDRVRSWPAHNGTRSRPALGKGPTPVTASPDLRSPP